MKHRCGRLTAVFAGWTAALGLVLAAAAGCESAGQAAPDTPAGSAAPAMDQFAVTAHEAYAGRPMTGRLVLMCITDTDRRWSIRPPLDGPWLENPQPIASVAVEQWDGSEPVIIDDDVAAVFGGPLDALSGPVRVQAMLQIGDDRPRLVPGTGSLYSETVSFDAGETSADRVEITLNRRIDELPQRALPVNLRFVRLPSELLSNALGREVFHQCAVVLPMMYRQRTDVRWPVVYVIPDRLDNPTRSALDHAQMMRVPGVEEIAPHAVHIILDPQTARGHHGFVDSELHGQRATALVTELIPHLEDEYWLKAEPNARLVTGIGLGGWSALWLMLQHPDVFGACWATAPTPVDFTAMQNIDLHEATNAFRDSNDQPHWTYRRTGMRIDEMIPATTSEQMWRMEQAVDPDGGSGGLWQVLSGMYCPVNAETGDIVPLFDSDTGAINEAAREHWMQYDIVRLLRRNPQQYLPLFSDRVHLFCGELDSFYFDRAVRRLRDVLAELDPGGETAAASIVLIEGATHENAQRYVFDDWNRQMREHLQRHSVDVK